MRKQGDGYVIRSEESITLDDVLQSYTRIMESAVRRSCWRTQCD
ncbi:hypothetical protein [Dialister invisus]